MMVNVTAPGGPTGHRVDPLPRRDHCGRGTLMKGVWTTRMDIKVGFVASPRDIVISSTEDRAAVLSRVEEFLAGTTGTLRLEDSKGAVTVLVREQVAFIEVGASASRAVGFI